MRNPKHLLNPVAFIPIVFGTTALFCSVASGKTTSYLVKAGDTPCEIAESLKIPCANLRSICTFSAKLKRQALQSYRMSLIYTCVSDNF